MNNKKYFFVLRLYFLRHVRNFTFSVGSYVILLANFGRSKNLVFFEGLGCIEIKKNVFQFFFSILCILQTRFKIIPFLRYSSHDKWVVNVTAFQCYSCVGHKTLRRNFDVVSAAL